MHSEAHIRAPNKLISVESSRDNRIWDKDARYEYYPYGPLKRIAIGEDSVQAADYVYTIEGWLKGINHPTLDPSHDPGGDGNPVGTGKTKFSEDNIDKKALDFAISVVGFAGVTGFGISTSYFILDQFGAFDPSGIEVQVDPNYLPPSDAMSINKPIFLRRFK